VVNKNYHTQL